MLIFTYIFTVIIHGLADERINYSARGGFLRDFLKNEGNGMFL